MLMMILRIIGVAFMVMAIALSLAITIMCLFMSVFGMLNSYKREESD